MRQIIFSVISLCALAMSAQVTVVEQGRLLNDAGPAYFPRLDASASRMLYCTGDAQGLSMLNLTTGEVTAISEDPGAGIDARFDNGGDVLYVTQAIGDDRLIYRTGRRYDVATARSEVVLEAQHGAVLPETGTAGSALRGAKRSYAPPRAKGTSVYTEGSELVITTGGVTHRYSPVESYAGYLWSSLSPDGKKVVFFAAGRGIVVTDLKGNVLSELGNYEMPSWLNNDYVVAQNATDDGHQFTSSQVLVLKADGTFKQELTQPTSMTMQPNAANNMVVYTTIDGLLHYMKLAVEP